MEEFDKKWKQKMEQAEQREEEPSESSVKKMMQRLDKELPVQVEKQTKVRFMGMSMRIAASIAIIAVFGYLVYSLNQVEIIVGKRAQSEVSLPDGSSVMINSDSRLAYNKLTWFLKRQVQLEGEAFFEVQKGEKFSVHSPLGVTEVLGTSFNVLGRPKHLRVKCHTGKVGVRSNRSSASVILTPGEGVAIRNDKPVKFAFDLKSQLDWRSGEFYFDSIPFEEVIEELERQYAVVVQFPSSLSSEAYTGYFDNRNFDKAMRLICGPFGLAYDSVGNRITITQVD